MASSGMRVSVPSCIQATRWRWGLSNVSPGQGENTMTRLTDILVVFVAIDDIEGLGERQKMRLWIRTGDPAHAVQVVGAENVAGNMPAK